MALFTPRISCIYRSTLISKLILVNSTRSQVPCQPLLVAGTIVTKQNALVSKNPSSRPKCYSTCNRSGTPIGPSTITPATSGFLYSIRHKSSNKRRKGSNYERKQDESDDDDDSDDSDVLERGSDFRDVKVKLSSLRMDVVLKAGLNLSRNKVEAAFYASKIRVNGEKILKKSSQVSEGDEVDVASEESAPSPQTMYVSRVVVRRTGHYNTDRENMTAILRRYPKLLIERPSDQSSDKDSE